MNVRFRFQKKRTNAFKTSAKAVSMQNDLFEFKKAFNLTAS